MNNPNVTASEPTEPLDVAFTPAAEIEEAAPRSYIAAGVVAALLIVLLCVVGVALLGSGVLTARPAPTQVPNTQTSLEVAGGIAPNGSFSLRGVNFAAGERVELFVAFVPGAAFNQFTKIADAQAGSDGSFALTGLRLPASADNRGTIYLLARGSSSGFSPIVPFSIGGVAPPTAPVGGATVTLAPTTPLPPTFTPPPTPLPDQPTYTPSPVTPTNPPTQSPTPDPNAVGIWYGRYYDNPDLGEPPVFVRYDANLNFNWRSGSPGGGIPNDNFSVLWTRNENFKTTDNYAFTLSVDDGARVYVDNVLVINEWRNGGLRTVKGNASIAKGIHQIKVEYYEATGNAQVALTWGVGYVGWVGRYYNSPDLSGPIIVKRDDVTPGDPFINFDWGFGSPDAAVNPDNFSVDWTRTVNFPLAGMYIFTATVDDGVRLYIDGNAAPVFDNFATSGSRTITGSMALSAGPHAMEVQYVERSGQAKFLLSWTPVILPPTSTPTLTLVPPSVTPGPPTNTPTATSTAPPTHTPTITLTPSHTPTPSTTPTLTATATITGT
jgi:hypothetical protein